jgi:hypothetical protein
MSIPKYDELTWPLLELLKDGQSRSTYQAADALSDSFGLIDEERAALLPSGGQTYMVNRTGWAGFHLDRAGLVTRPQRGRWQIGSTIALNGYSKEHEKEADLYAFMYLQDRGKGVKPLISVLKKIRTAEETHYTTRGALLGSDSHPASKDRLFIIESASYRKPPSLVYDGVNKTGELVYTLSFDGVCTYTQRDGAKLCKVFAQVDTSSAIGKPVEVTGLNLRNKTEFLYFNIDGKVEISPLDRTGLAFFTRSDAPEFFTDDLVPAVEGISADKVTRRSSP